MPLKAINCTIFHPQMKKHSHTIPAHADTNPLVEQMIRSHKFALFTPIIHAAYKFSLEHSCEINSVQGDVSVKCTSSALISRARAIFRSKNSLASSLTYINIMVLIGLGAAWSGN
jgi:hypothetical protein